VTDHGLFGGTSLFFDFENRRAARQTRLITSLYTVGYAYNCCSPESDSAHCIILATLFAQ
jgi:hypothetical protein